MTIRRAMPTVRSTDLEASRGSYVDFLRFETAMDQTGLLMLRSPSTPTTQLIVATEGAEDHEVLRADVSVEVADVDAVYGEAERRGLEIVYPWPTSHGASAASSCVIRTACHQRRQPHLKLRRVAS